MSSMGVRYGQNSRCLLLVPVVTAQAALPCASNAPARTASQAVAQGRLHRWPLRALAWPPRGRAGSGGGAAAPVAAAAPGRPCMAAHAMGWHVRHRGTAGRHREQRNGRHQEAPTWWSGPAPLLLPLAAALAVPPGAQARAGTRRPASCCRCEGSERGEGRLQALPLCRCNNWVSMSRDGSAIGRLRRNSLAHAAASWIE